MDHLILKYLRGELSLEERHKLNKWLDEDPARRGMIKAFESYWVNSHQDFGNEKIEVLAKIRSEIKQKEEGKKPLRWVTLKYLKYAAVFLLVSLVSIFIYSSIESQSAARQTAVRHIEKTSLAGQNISLKLPDGSSVKLNAESKLLAPEIFQGSTREVELVGEAFFDIVPDPSHPFIIKMNGMTVEVLGTSFDVKAYQEDANQLVAVKTGKVKVKSTMTGKEVQLIPHEMSLLNNVNGDLISLPINNEQLFFGWINKQIVFQDQQIDEVFKEIKRWYGVEIILEKKLSGRKLYTAQHDNPTIEEVLRSLSFVYEFDFKKKDEKTIVIY